jgi:rubrerythrin
MPTPYTIWRCLKCGYKIKKKTGYGKPDKCPSCGNNHEWFVEGQVNE